MLYRDLIQETYLAIIANKVRSILTMLGIVIGIASVIAMVSIGQGAKQSITDSIESNGSNLLTVSPGKQRSFGPVSAGQGSADSLTTKDADAIASINNIEAVSPESSGRYQVTAGENNANSSVSGVQPAYETVKNITVANGSFVNQNQVTSLTKVAVLGATVATDLFGEDADPVGKTVRISNMNFKVIGVLEETGSGFNSSDDAVIIPLSVLQRYYTGSDTLSSISVKIATAEAMTTAQEDITDLLLDQHKITDADNADFNVRNSADMLAMANSVTSTLTMLLGSIAAISLLVGGIGIMNMMLTTVTERTREIGLRKAIGAKSSEINRQFLAESVMLTFVGGAIGVALGKLAAILVTKFLSTTTSVSLYSVALAFSVSVVIGIVFGYYPARRAAKLNPIDALRYE